MSRADALKRMWVLMVTTFVDMMGFAIIFPLLPYYAEKLGASPLKIGALISIFFVAQLITAPFWGRLSDRIGRRPVIFSGLLITAVAFLVFELADSVWLLFAARFIQGAGGGKTGVLQAYVTDTSRREDRAEALGWLSAATSAGVMIGPVIGSLASQSAIVRPGYIASTLCLVALAFAWRWLPESKGKATDAGDPFGQHPAKGAIWSITREILARPHRGIGSLVWIYAFGMMAFMAMNAILVLYFERRFGITEREIGWFFLYVATISLVMRALLLGPLVRRFGEIWVLRAGTVCMVAGFFTIPLARSIWELGLAALFIPAGTALLFPATTSLVSAKAGKEQTGVVLGVHQGFGGVSRMTGPMWAGWMFQSLGIRTPFWAAGALMAAVSLFALTVVRNEPPPESEEGPEIEPVPQA